MIRIRKAAPDDLDDVFHLLGTAALTTDGVRENFSSFLVAEEEGLILAVAGLEKEGTSVLLRSVAVSPTARGTGLGVEIVRQALRLAIVSGATTAYLMTTTAAPFFARLGFGPVLRTEVDATFPDSAETKPGGCGPAAEPMVLRDLDRALTPRPRTS